MRLSLHAHESGEDDGNSREEVERQHGLQARKLWMLKMVFSVFPAFIRLYVLSRVASRSSSDGQGSYGKLEFPNKRQRLVPLLNGIFARNHRQRSRCVQSRSDAKQDRIER